MGNTLLTKNAPENTHDESALSAIPENKWSVTNQETGLTQLFKIQLYQQVLSSKEKGTRKETFERQLSTATHIIWLLVPNHQSATASQIPA